MNFSYDYIEFCALSYASLVSALQVEPKEETQAVNSRGPTKGLLTELLHHFVYELKVIQFIASI